MNPSIVPLLGVTAPEEGKRVSVETHTEVTRGNEVFTSVTGGMMGADKEQAKRTIGIATTASIFRECYV